ncbi:MAG TPA: type 2 lanthipeptide synthetase LanM family protein [Gemmatimonadaceae bacterium]|nr:type 2 lanthipeptide synthetase LanM family protein [Gemmatimonadaceae bacterium]
MATTWWPSALTLAERAAMRRDRSPSQPNEPASAGVTNRANRWRSQRPFDRPGFLARRLRIDGLTETEFDTLVDALPPGGRGEAEPPRWAREVERADAIAREIAQLPARTNDSSIDGLGPVRAFVEPFVTAGMARLHAEARSIVAECPRAPFDAERATLLFEPLLWGHLLGRALKVVILELNVARVRGTLLGDSPEARCAHFASQLRTGPVRDQIIDEYPVLARSIVTATDYWVESGRELLRYLAEDVDALRDAFGIGGELGTLTSISGNAGDVHRGGRSVAIAEFSSGIRVVFKPRPLDVDRHFADLVAWINALEQAPKLRAVRVLTRGDHGWAEFVSEAPCDSRDEVERFYQRFGAWLAVLHVLNATDFHYENVIAAGEFPMLIDLEALFHPLPEAPNAGDEPEQLGWEALQRSVLRTGVLPFRAYDNEQSSGLDMSAMGGTGGQRTPNRFPVLVAPGTDEMRLERDFVSLPPSQNRPTLGGQPVDPATFGDALLAGFTATYRLLLAHRAALLAPHGPVRAFANDPIRVVLRPTRQYALMLAESNHPDVMRDALDRDRLFDRLWIAVPGRPELERVIAWEHADLLDGDIPMFTSKPSSVDLFATHGEAIPGFFRHSGLSSAIERIEAMSADDLRHQRWVVEASLVALLPGMHSALTHDESVPELRVVRSTTELSREEALRAARRVADHLVARALRQGDRVSWLGLTLLRERDWTVQPVGSDLYSGAAGIAFFLAYFDHILGDVHSRAVARTVVGQLTRRLVATLDASGSATAFPPSSLGAFGALSGAVYALAHIGALWADHNLIDLAERLVVVLGDHVDADRTLDIIGGTAGFIMAASALEQVRSAPVTRRALAHAAESLVARAEERAGGLAWSTSLPASQPLTGMSHGASGIALALLTAGRLLNHPPFVDAAMRALCYERGCFDPMRTNWPDYRILPGRDQGEPLVWMWAWCHGAPGIGLVRLDALGSSDDPELASDLAAALASTTRSGFGSNDSLCHGDLGNLELFVRAYELGYRGEWEVALAAHASRLVARLREGFWRCGVPGAVETPGLMTGLAGIGYGLLRIAAPERVPSLLALEPPRVTIGVRGGQ